MSYDLTELKEATELILRAIPKGSDFGAVNYGDLHCTAALRCEDEYGEITYRVEIEEVAPDAYKLAEYVAKHLAKQGYKDIEVHTEW